MLRIRMTEEAICELYPEQEMRCPVHLCIGQEAIAAGVCANLKKQDYVMSNHRSHGHYLAKGGDMKAMFAEIYGKKTGCSNGKGGSMHLVDLSVNILGTTPIVGGIIPVAAGVALASLMKGRKNLTTVFLGDAAAEEGVFYETLNFSALKKLPVLFICENNFYSVYSPLSVRQPKERNNIALAKALGVAAGRGQGNNVLDVYNSAAKAVRHIRNGFGPYYLEFETYRLREHCGINFDNDLGYRGINEIEKWNNLCPLELFEKKLLDQRIISKKWIDDLRIKIQAEIDQAVEFAKNSRFPLPEEAVSGVFSI
ncbi:MAG: thiamine pyrophosphate-dependent dehydrogenase E1 component subunit alpha [Candidatus Omnitrophica bacterium]|nr:thiamine pyrophosphate-dependent dehydrogenase E1 component subunit alpha [Candidatus Omnitrophota bacterium]